MVILHSSQAFYVYKYKKKKKSYSTVFPPHLNIYKMFVIYAAIFKQAWQAHVLLPFMCEQYFCQAILHKKRMKINVKSSESYNGFYSTASSSRTGLSAVLSP